MISVIVPVYNVEKYLGRCVDSILAQTYSDLEIILVDDGSPDNCGSICDEYALKDSRVIVIHKENGGLSDARNYGVEQATGKYIAFVDSDDYIAPHYMAYLRELMITNKADIAVCGMVETDGDTVIYREDDTMPPVRLLTGMEACYELFNDLYMVLVTAWGKLYKRELVKMNLFPKGRKHEDEATTCKYYFESERVVIGNQQLYAYYQNPSSITHTQGEKLNEDAIWALKHKAQFFEERGQYDLARAAWLNYFYFCVDDSLKYGGRCDTYLQELENICCLDDRSRMKLSIYRKFPVLFRVIYWLHKSANVIKRSMKK